MSPTHSSPDREGSSSPPNPGPRKRRAGKTAAERLIILETWLRSRLSAGDFTRFVDVSPHQLYTWKRRFDRDGPAGLEPARVGRPKGSRLPEPTRRAILLMKETHPDWGIDRIHDMLLRTEGFQASATAISRLLKEEGYEAIEVAPRRHPDRVRRFERSTPNDLWQSDLFNFTVVPSSYRIHVVAFLDDRSRFIVGHGVSGSSAGSFVIEVLRTAVANFGAPKEMLTDRGPQYHSWRGTSAFRKVLGSMGVKHILARPRHPQTVGKTERWWKTLWGECLQSQRPRDVGEARERIGHFVDYYNFRRTHQGIDGLVPADVFFSAAPEVRKSLEARVAENALELAKHGQPRKAFYLTGRMGDETVSFHAEGEKVVMTKDDGTREEVDLSATGPRQDGPAPREPDDEEESGEAVPA
jgi:transposase InsO family protein